ncbi:MAG: hypothetical protein RBR41_07925 [Desulfovibrio sp.]|uniref:hypothetical protein n=1 Tax=Desulfovibrio sp. TaxID=885 RepID=UPI002A3658D3|nr:hypothetical protein [Desulfovibrio sp.]MDY0259582.1 hypothetical protein [Desulfovibrio sp.]
MVLPKTVKAIRFVLQTGIFASSLVAAITDFLSPLGPYCKYITILLFITCASTIVMVVIPRVDRRMRSITKYWFFPLWCSIFTALLVFGVMSYLAKTSNPQKGFIASHSSSIEKFQSLLFEISESSQKIAANTEKTAENTAKIHGKLGQLKQEKSNDPRKELANFGISWNIREYNSMVEQGDIQILKLFYEGGIAPNIVIANTKINPIYNACVNQTHNYKTVYKQALEFGFSPDEKLPIKLPYPSQITTPSTFEYYYIEQIGSKNIKQFSLGEFLAICWTHIDDDQINFIVENNIAIKTGLAYRKEAYDFLLNKYQSRKRILENTISANKELFSATSCADVYRINTKDVDSNFEYTLNSERDFCKIRNSLSRTSFALSLLERSLDRFTAELSTTIALLNSAHDFHLATKKLEQVKK